MSSSEPSTPSPKTKSGQLVQVDEAAIVTLVDCFYGKVRADEELGPLFEAVVKGQWARHLNTMYDFWSSVMLGTGRYKGNPMLKHMQVAGIERRHFARWLTLFQQTAEELFVPEIAARFGEKSQRIAESLQLGLFYRPDQIRARSGGPRSPE